MTNCCRRLPTRSSGATGVTARCRRLFTEFGRELRSRAGWRWICNEINMPRHARKRSLAYTEHEHDPRIVNFLATESNFFCVFLHVLCDSVVSSSSNGRVAIGPMLLGRGFVAGKLHQRFGVDGFLFHQQIAERFE